MADWTDTPERDLDVIRCNINRLDLNKQGCGNYWTDGPVAAQNLAVCELAWVWDEISKARQAAKIK